MAAKPALVRSLINSRSYSAKLTTVRAIIRPAAVVRSRLKSSTTSDQPCSNARLSYDKIAAALVTEGILSPAGRPNWQASTVRRIYQSATSAIEQD